MTKEEKVAHIFGGRFIYSKDLRAFYVPRKNAIVYQDGFESSLQDFFLNIDLDEWSTEPLKPIKVGDKLRNLDGDILEVLKIHMGMAIFCFIDGNEIFSGDCAVKELEELLYWMPLPKPPKGENKND